MIADGELEPGVYRITLDDGRTVDRELTGVSRLPSGDILTAQPYSTTDAETVYEDQIPMGRVSMITTRDGDVWLFPTNRLAEAVRADQAQIVTMASDYLDQAPFASPTLSFRSDVQVAALLTVLGLESPAEGAESPASRPGKAKRASTPSAVSSPKAGAPAEAQKSSPEQPSASPVDQQESQPASPVLAESSPPAGLPDGPTESATAKETLVVTPHDPEPDAPAPDRMTITIDSGTLSGTVGTSAIPQIINVEDEPVTT